MKARVVVCGLNGCGKSTLGKALAEALGCAFLDVEDYYFPKQNPDYLYDAPRSQQEVEQLMLADFNTLDRFVFACVGGAWGSEITQHFTHAVMLSVPKDERLRRIRERSFRKFGDRMLPGGDLYEREQRFFELAASRDEQRVERWVSALGIPVLRLDGAQPVVENVEKAINTLKYENLAASRHG